ncbi:MAG: ABC transporter ATP-binding protein [Alphaproteobacteria bacterium]|nr:ABC transporter ATP-binding protein [Alphaproteobacteria bacterium]
MTTVELKKVAKRYGQTAAIDGVSLAIAKGEFVTLLGPSGCGKTTTLRVVAGLVESDAGSVSLGNIDVTNIPTHKRNIGMVFQSHALFPHMTVEENVSFGLRMRGVAADQRSTNINRALELVRLPGFNARYPHQLSGGQQQRVALARALVIQPSVLLLDEPFGALDRKLRDTMQVELRELTRRIGITSIFVTHDQEEALILSDRIAVMNMGCIEQLGTPAEVFERPQTKFVADFMGVANFVPASVLGSRGPLTALDADGIAVESTDAIQAATGATIEVALRAEHITIGEGDAGTSSNSVAGSVASAVYHGNASTYEVMVPGRSGQRRLVVREANRGATGVRFATGAKVALSWPSGAVRLLSR